MLAEPVRLVLARAGVPGPVSAQWWFVFGRWELPVPAVTTNKANGEEPGCST